MTARLPLALAPLPFFVLFLAGFIGLTSRRLGALTTSLRSASE